MINIKKISIFFRKDNEKAIVWNKKIKDWLSENYPEIKNIPLQSIKRKKDMPDVFIVLGGDGTIMEVAHKYADMDPLLFCLNLGHIGFMASVRKEKDFLKGLDLLLKNKFSFGSRMMLSAKLIRNGKEEEEWSAMNEIAVQNLFGMVDIEVKIENHPLQYIHGNGVLVSTASGTTAYNLSAHGPIVMPELDCFVITELLDHNIPTPSIVIKEDKNITLTIIDFREENRFIIAKNKKKADVVMAQDGIDTIPLKKGDKILIKKSEYRIRFAEIEPNYFFKSLQEKFAFK